MEQETFTAEPLNGNAFEIARLIHGYLTKKKIGYSLISQKFLLDKLGAWYGIHIHRSVLCYNLRVLVEKGYIKRVPRHRRNPITGQFEPRVTLFAMTIKLRALFSRLAFYFRGIGWRNLIEHQQKRAAIRAAAIRAEEAKPIEGAPRNLAEFQMWGRALFGGT